MNIKVGDVVRCDLTGNICKVLQVTDRNDKEELPVWLLGSELTLLNEEGELEWCYCWEVSLLHNI